MFEYQVVIITDLPSGSGVSKQLNELGHQGWEPVGGLSVVPGHGTHSLLVKRDVSMISAEPPKSAKKP